MADVYTKAKRSEVMSAVRGRGNRSTEWRLRARLISSGISGWRLHPRDIIGKPDFVFPKELLIVFIDGCFWHGCKKCRTIPATRRAFWLKKIEGNRRRDAVVTRTLKKAGWTVLRFWEHEIKRRPQACLDDIRRAVSLKGKTPR